MVWHDVARMFEASNGFTVVRFFCADAPVKILTLNFGAYIYYFPNLCYLCDEIKIGPWLRGVLSRRKH